MALIYRFISKRIANLINKFNDVPPPMVEQFENKYPLKSMGDHHRFLL